MRVLFIFLCFSFTLQATPKNVVVEAQVIHPVPKFLVKRRYIGTIRAENFSLLSPKVARTVASVDVVAGQQVKKDQILISLKNESEKRSKNLAERNLALAKKELDRNFKLRESLIITGSAMDKNERDFLNASTELENARRQVEDFEIRSPIEGIAGVPRVVRGQTVQPGEIVISVIKGPFLVFINIPGSRLTEVKEGQTVMVKSATTTVSAVERTIDPVTRTGFAKAVFSSCESCIVGESVYVYIVVHEKPNAILVNRNAVFYKNKKPHVVAVVKAADGSLTADIREVVVGIEQEGQVEILSGINDGDEIVTANPKRVNQGAKVTVVK